MKISISERVARRLAAVLVLLGCGLALPAQTLPPHIAEGGVTEAAQFLHMVAPGSIATAFGENFADDSFEADSIPLPLELGGVRVEVNGVPAPLYFVSAGQINFQIPFETQLGEASVVVFHDGVASAAETVEVKSYVPAAFKNAATGEAIVVIAGSAQLIDAEHPAVADQALTVFINGFGLLDNPPATGAASPVDPLARTIAIPRVRLGDQEVTVYYAGLAPGYVGLGQLNLGLPANLPEGTGSALPLSIDFDGSTAPIENLPVVLPAPPAPDVGIEITNVTPSSIFPGDSFRVDYTLATPTGYVGEAEVTFFLQLANSYTTLEHFTVELTGVDVALSRDLTTHETMFPGSYSLQGEVSIPGDGNPSNDNFTLEQPFVIEARSGEPNDVGVEITSVTPAQIAPGDTLTYKYKLLNLSGYSGPVDVTFQLSTSSSGRVLLTEPVMLEGAERELVREVATPVDLPIDTYRPVMRVQIENDTDPSNNIALFSDSVVVAAPAAPLSETPGEAPPLGELTEGNLSDWQLVAYRGQLPVDPGIRLGDGAAPVVGRSFLTGVAPSANRLILHYPRAAALKTNWDLSDRRSLEFWVSLGANASLSAGHPRIVLHSAHGSRTLTLVEQTDWTPNFFQRLNAPLNGDANWAVANQGAFDTRHVTGFDLDFQFDKSGGIAVNLDGVEFK